MSTESKDPDEIITIAFPFGGELGGAAITGIDFVTIALVSGSDPAVATMLNGAAVMSGSDVLQSVRYGVDGCNYKLRCRVALSDSRNLVRALSLPVRAF